MPYLELALLWAFWCALHSLLITPAVTGFLEKRLGEWFRYYRIFYNGFSLGSLAPVVWYGRQFSGPVFFDFSGPWALLRALLLVSAATLFMAGAKNYDAKAFLGLSQLRGDGGEKACAALSEACELRTDGVLGLVRHPWYTAALCLIWSRSLDTAALTVNIVLTAYFIIGTFLEERKLIAQFGDDYREYQTKVSMFLPVKWAAGFLKK